jgi:three-Cys-motif partner protein
MDTYWGDGSWRQAAYNKLPGLFGDLEEKADNEAVAKAFQERLRRVAGFRYVAEPLPMPNSTGAIVYYLFFASPNKDGAKIVGEIFEKYRDRGIRHGT